MSFRISYAGGFNPFEWEALRCPVCGSSEYVSQDYCVVYCVYCWAEFRVRHTAGDPGCVVDCFPNEVYAPLWECEECSERAGFFDWQEPACPKSKSHSMRKVEGLWKLWKHPNTYPTSFYLILKIGDYCSGWLAVPHDLKKEPIRPIGHPTQEQWNRFQDRYLFPDIPTQKVT